MTEKLTDVWASRDFPVLVEVARRIDAGESTVSVSDVAQALAMDEQTVQLAGAALKRRGLVDTIGAFGVPVLRFRHLSADAYFVTGLHPSGDDAVSQLVDLLRQAADGVDDPQEKSRLRALADAAGGVSREVLAGVLTALATGAMN
jgi:DNA-binding transcriptional MocR family regulator